MKAYQMWESYKEGLIDWSLSYWQELHENLFSNWLEEVGLHFSQDSLVVLEEFRVVYPIVWKFPKFWDFFTLRKG